MDPQPTYSPPFKCPDPPPAKQGENPYLPSMMAELEFLQTPEGRAVAAYEVEFKQQESARRWFGFRSNPEAGAPFVLGVWLPLAMLVAAAFLWLGGRPTAAPQPRA